MVENVQVSTAPSVNKAKPNMFQPNFGPSKKASLAPYASRALPSMASNAPSPIKSDLHSAAMEKKPNIVKIKLISTGLIIFVAFCSAITHSYPENCGKPVISPDVPEFEESHGRIIHGTEVF